MGSADKAIIISAGDAGYFPLLRDLVHSIHLHRPAGDVQTDIGIVDIGMTEAQIAELRPLVNHIVPGRWNFDFPLQAAAPRWAQALTIRPFLRDYFKGYARYLWVDGDVWLQDWRAISLMSSGRDDELIITPEIHCAYPHLYGLGTLLDTNRRLCTESFGAQAAAALANKAIINAGMFSAGAGSPFWKPYGELVQQGFRRQPNKWTEQLAMNLAIYTGTLKVRPLPAWCNWICTHALPSYDPVEKCLCEATPPHQKLSAIHLTGEYREHKTIWISTTHTIRTRIDFSSIRQLRNKGALELVSA